MLYLVATPIGNLSDMTFRSIEILKSVDYILCEDTRHSLSLLRHYAIHKPLKSYHKFSSANREQEIVEDLCGGKNIALISDAGTPGISDPGAQLVKACIEKGIIVSSIPGACAVITALSCSGLDTDRFQFCGFLPRKAGELRHLLNEMLLYPGTSICYESPLRLDHTLKCLQELSPERQFAICRELTKKHEEIHRGSAQELLEQWKEGRFRGEIVLLIPGIPPLKEEQWKNYSINEHVEELQKSYGLSKKEAIKMAAEMRGIPKRQVYNQIIK